MDSTAVQFISGLVIYRVIWCWTPSSSSFTSSSPCWFSRPLSECPSGCSCVPRSRLQRTPGPAPTAPGTGTGTGRPPKARCPALNVMAGVGSSSPDGHVLHQGLLAHSCRSAEPGGPDRVLYLDVDQISRRAVRSVSEQPPTLPGASRPSGASTASTRARSAC